MKFKGLDLAESLLESLVNIEEKTRSNLFSWRGQFSPQLIEQILINYSSDNAVVFDPFLGSGTVLFECASLGLKAIGCDINPAAIAFAKVYELVNYPKDEVLKAVSDIDLALSKYTNYLPLFKSGDISDFNRDFDELVINQKDEIKKIILTTLIIGIEFGDKELESESLDYAWKTLCKKIEKLPYSKNDIICFQSDARKTGIRENSIDFVLTSPPYINVFNYHQNYRKSVEKLGINVLRIAKSEIGANRKFRQNRFLTVVQYCMDISQVFLELRRICKSDAKIIFIVGRESNVKKTAFRNADLISSVARICGFNLVGYQSRVFLNKYGKTIYEEILRFTVSQRLDYSIVENARYIGQKALYNALSYCEQELVSEIKSAIEKSKNIDTSPILETKHNT